MLGYCSGGMTKLERIGGIEIGEDADVDDSENHVKFLLGVDAVGRFFGLEREREDIGGKVDVCEVANAIGNSERVQNLLSDCH